MLTYARLHARLLLVPLTLACLCSASTACPATPLCLHTAAVLAALASGPLALLFAPPLFCACSFGSWGFEVTIKVGQDNPGVRRSIAPVRGRFYEFRSAQLGSMW